MSEFRTSPSTHIMWMSVGALALLAVIFSLGIAYGTVIQQAKNHKALERTEVQWKTNPPDVTLIHKDEICFSWDGKDKRIACIER